MVSEGEKREIEDRATAGDVTAQIYLGWAYGRHGIYGYDEDRAEYWLRRAAASDDLEALRRLSRFLYDHQREETRKVAEVLANRGDFYGHYVLGHLFLHGDCKTELDRDVGIKHLRAAADLGHLISELDLLKNLPRSYYINPITFLKMTHLMGRIFSLLLRDPGNVAIYR